MYRWENKPQLNEIDFSEEIPYINAEKYRFMASSSDLASSMHAKSLVTALQLY